MPAGQMQTEGASNSHSILKCVPLQEAAGEGANHSQLMGIYDKTTRQRAWKKENSLRPKYAFVLSGKKVLGVLK